MNNPVPVLYVSYFGVLDPLGQSQVIPYLRALAKDGYCFHLISFERPVAWNRMTPNGREQISSALAAEGIHWYPRLYHHRPILLAKMWDILTGIFLSLILIRRHGIQLVHCRATVASTVGYGVKKLLRVKFLYDLDGLLADQYVDYGHWKRNGIFDRVTTAFQRRFLASADAVVFLTERLRESMRHSLTKNGQIAPTAVIPCCVDLQVFPGRPNARQRVRAMLGIGAGPLCLYAGKTGGPYLIDEMAQFFGHMCMLAPEAHLLILTLDDPVLFEEVLRRRGITAGYTILGVSRAEIPDFLSAADLGFSFVQPVASSIARSPVKNAEYLACGLPVVSTTGIGDYSEFIRQHRVGIVIPELSAHGFREGAAEALRLLSEGERLRERCRRVATAYLAVDPVGRERYRWVYGKVLNEAASRCI